MHLDQPVIIDTPEEEDSRRKRRTHGGSLDTTVLALTPTSFC
jgi:hypothetical protein